MGRAVWGAVVLGFVLAARALAPAAAAQDLVNPIAASADSLARGRDIYSEHCAICHGVQGRGDGPLARTMVPRPADFRVHLAEGHTESQLYGWVTDGVPDTAMQGFADQLGVDDRWHVINYIMTFAPADR